MTLSYCKSAPALGSKSNVIAMSLLVLTRNFRFDFPVGRQCTFNRDFHSDFPADRQYTPNPINMQCSSRIPECRAFPTAAAKSQSQKLTLLPPIPQTLFVLQSRSVPKSVSVYGSPILLVMGAPQSFAACPQTAAAFVRPCRHWTHFAPL